MLKVKIGRNGVELYQEGGLKVSFVQDSLSVVADSVTVEFEEGVPAFSIQIDDMKPVKQRSPSTPSQRRGAGKRKKIADYIEDVFRERDRPLKTNEIADLVLDAGFETESESFVYTIRTAMAREEDRFIQYGSYHWGLKVLTRRWISEGKLDGIIEEPLAAMELDLEDDEQHNNNLPDFNPHGHPSNDKATFNVPDLFDGKDP